jgi:hypothetical protein
MARKLSTFDFSKKSVITPPESSRRYPWDDWLDGDIWELRFGEDFDSHPLMMERIIRTRATNRGAKLKMRHVRGDQDFHEAIGVIVLQRVDIDGPTKREERNARRREQRARKKAMA